MKATTLNDSFSPAKPAILNVSIRSKATIHQINCWFKSLIELRTGELVFVCRRLLDTRRITAIITDASRDAWRREVLKLERRHGHYNDVAATNVFIWPWTSLWPSEDKSVGQKPMESECETRAAVISVIPSVTGRWRQRPAVTEHLYFRRKTNDHFWQHNQLRDFPQ